MMIMTMTMTMIIKVFIFVHVHTLSIYTDITLFCSCLFDAIFHNRNVNIIILCGLFILM